MNTLTSWQGALTSSWGQVWASFLSILPRLFGGILIFAIGLIIAYWVKKLIADLLRIAKVDNYAKKAGIQTYLAKADVKLTLSGIIATLFEWLIILVFFLSVVEILGLTIISQVLLRVLSYIPNIIASAFIFGVSYLFAGLIGGLVRGALSSVDADMAKPVGKATRWLIILVGFFAAIDQLKIAQSLIATFFQGLTYTIVLVIGLSVGLGAKDLVSKVLTDWYEKIKK